MRSCWGTVTPRRRETWLHGRRVAYLEAGAGPPVLIAHGLGLSGAVFRGHCRALAGAGFRAIAPDLPSFGHSEGPRYGMTVGETAEWLLDFARALELGSVMWLGHSLGAQAVMAAAESAPQRARALVLATPTGAPGRARLLHQAVSFVRDVDREPLSLIPIVAKQYLRGSLLSFIFSWIKAARDRPMERAHRIRCPTLIVTGRRDPVVPKDFVSILCNRIPGARVQRLHGPGHGAVINRSTEFDRIVIEFLRETVQELRPSA